MKKRLLRICVSAALVAAGILVPVDDRSLELGFFLAAYIIAGGGTLVRAVRSILRGQVFNESFLMSIATIGAMIIGEYPEGVAVMLFYQIGELFQNHAVDKSRRSITALMEIRPDHANVICGGDFIETDPDEVRVGDIIAIRAGERVPLDAVVTSGHSMLDTSALTGESVPREVSEGSEILSGCVNLSGLLTAEVTKEYGQSTVSRILDLVENAAARKAGSEQFITRFARYYTPVVVVLAVLISAVPPLFISGAVFEDWVYRGLTFLVISCPCALVVSIPLGFFGGIGGASKKGLLFKGSNYLEALSRTEIVVFDKTGTLTEGLFEVREIMPVAMENGELLELAAYAEFYSSHPISVSIKKAFGGEIDGTRIGSAREMPGHGVSAVVDGRTVLAGNAGFMEKENISCCETGLHGTIVHISADGDYAGYIVISDVLKEDSYKAVADLRQTGIRKIVMLTGDAKNVGEKAAKDLGLDAVYTELLPAGKVEKLEELLREKSEKGKLVFVGDGINDAPVLARSDIGVAMGGLGSDAAIEAADVVIMTDEPSKIAGAIRISKRTIGIVRQNIVFSLAVKSGVLLLAAAGIVSMWAGVVADVGVTLIAVLNATRSLDVRKV